MEKIKENKLEEIFFVFGRYFDKEGREIKPKPIGLPKIVHSNNEEDIMKDITKKLNKEDFNANAFVKGERAGTSYDVGTSSGYIFYWAIQLYKK